MDEDLAIFRDAASRFIEAEMVPNEDQWRKQQHVGKDIWRKAGAVGLLCTDVSADYGGVGGDFRHEAILYEELGRRGLSGFGQGVHSICAHYLVNHGTEEQKHRFLPRMASGELIGAIGMTEPVGRVRPAGDQDTRRSRWGPLRRQRIENLHHQWLSGRADRPGGQDASRRGSQGDLDSSGGNQGSRRLPGGPNPRQDGPEGAGHVGAVFRECARAGRQFVGRRRRVRASIS